jgi:3-deoxy-manno-octulosonate cytidylyltransferase (CMP-KDO synthetase)
MKIISVIPARFESTRFPGKPLVAIKGKSMIQRVYEQVILSKYIDETYVATDDQRIYDHVKSFHGNVIMTSSSHESGTDRIQECIKKINSNADFIINIQGDEPFIKPAQIDDLCKKITNETEIITMYHKIDNISDVLDPNKVKVIFNKANQAIYFSRAPIPFQKSIATENWKIKNNYYGHIGIYGYSKKTLENITKLPASNLETLESLEQLRWLENKHSIQVVESKYSSVGIDTPEDLNKALKLL